MATLSRRSLTFADEAAAIAEAEGLLRGGYARTGRLSLGQNCEHVARIIDFSLDGFPIKGPWIMRKVIGPRMPPFLLRRNRMPSGVPAPAFVRPVPQFDDSEGVAKLRQSFERFAAHTGQLHPSPLLGAMDKSQWQRLHLIHAAHHLGFLIPDQK